MRRDERARLNSWHDELADAWTQLQKITIAEQMPGDEQAALKRALETIGRVKGEMRAASAEPQRPEMLSAFSTVRNRG